MLATVILFILSLCLTLLFTPVARRFGYHVGAIDIPNQRKHHTQIKPRSGGLAIFLSYALTISIGTLFFNSADNVQFQLSREALYLHAGATLCFAVGFIDDIKQLKAKTKLIGQIIAASIAFYGGTRITVLPIIGTELPMWVSYIQTVFWFLLFINAINLIDGLDGLAAGICFFTCIMLVILLGMRGWFPSAICFAIIAGSLLGFLRYNFNPSVIFMGDGGSYFLGFIISGLSILGSAKGQLSALFLIPFVGMGVPIFDTVTTPIRRFLRGRKMFSPDNGHIHHKLIRMGLTTRKAVFFLYVLTTSLCLFTIYIVHVKYEAHGFVLVFGSLILVILLRLVISNRLTFKITTCWLRDLADATGISKDRRQFLDYQLRTQESKSVDELWSNICDMLKYLSIDFAEMRLKTHTEFCPHKKKTPSKQPYTYSCSGDTHNQDSTICKPGLMKLELPLLSGDGHQIGILWVIKDLKNNPLDPTTLTRLEQFRRTIVRTLDSVLQSEPKT
ncbi:glycosyltransferase family 4 protein [Desulfovibrio ferrophilus]|uniref:glycosyltransferase family 4 protein n=1 Tax=Desulfovibrio ferrophilus TaxID=241368 RepID=UPI000F819AA6|nr:MraY family glycosyltransferase [Desulfovibrio ferrophilus]